MKMNFRLKEIREERGYTKKEIAEFLHCAQATYSRYENNERYPTVKMIAKLADLYDVSVDYLTGRVDKADKNS